jgi:hypothetical protein
MRNVLKKTEKIMIQRQNGRDWLVILLAQTSPTEAIYESVKDAD